jgi:hypothetical protein
VSPIFVRPVREQLEHDRLIRHLQARYKRKFEVTANVGEEHVAPVRIGTSTFYPDLVLTDGKKLAGLVEVESAESVNNLEAMAQWVPFSRGRVPFHLYVPVHVYDVARRFCESHHAQVSEIWTYRASLEGFDLIRVFHDAGAATRNNSKKVAASIPPPPRKVAPPPPPPQVATPVARPAAKPGAKAPLAKTIAKPLPQKPAPPKAAVKPAAKTPQTSLGPKVRGSEGPRGRGAEGPKGSPAVAANRRTAGPSDRRTAEKVKRPARAGKSPARGKR